MKQAGVWSFRTKSGVARVVDGSLRQRYSIRGIFRTAYSQLGSGSVFRRLLIGFGISGAIGPISRLVEAVLTDGIIGGVVSAGLAAVLISTGTALTLSLPMWSLVGRSTAVDIYDITAVTVGDDCELTVRYADSDETKTTSLSVYNDEELDEAVEIFRLKGVSVTE